MADEAASKVYQESSNVSQGLSKSATCHDNPELKCYSEQCASLQLQVKMCQWLWDHRELCAADWLEEYWTGDRGDWTLAHGGVGGTNNNNGIKD